MHKYRMVVINGMEEVEITADSFRVYTEDGEYIELHPRRSDGEITLSARSRLLIRPTAANCARVESEA